MKVKHLIWYLCAAIMALAALAMFCTGVYAIWYFVTSPETGFYGKAVAVVIIAGIAMSVTGPPWD